MQYNNLVIINNEKISKEQENYYCDNVDVKSIPEGLSQYNHIHYISRKLKKKGNYRVYLKNVKIASNLIIFIFHIFKTFKIPDTKYLLMSVNPYTFCSFLFLYIFRKKIFVYLRSSGHEEYKYILGSWAVWIYDFMYRAVTSKSKVIIVNDKLHDKKKSYFAYPSKLDNLWLKNHTKPSLEKVKFLYVGRINPEKGILEFIKMFDDLKLNATLSIVSKEKNLNISNENVKLLGHGFDTQSLINIYDNNNITILPSYTEGHPQILDESLSRKRPVIIFEDIIHVIKDKKGIFVAKRNIDSFLDTVKYVMKNYQTIQIEMEKNKLPTREDFLKQITNIIKSN
tara:strand:+ start:186 stop:1205 length:1020 start_codon:yes stop_codon:yes gene_type:complete